MSETFCILPFIHVNSSVTGKYRPCCNTQKYLSFTDHEVSFRDAFESEEMENLRLQLLNGEKPDICSVCWKNEERGIRSQREVNNEKFKDFDQTKGLQFLDVKFDNKCNLQCRMCDPYSSNQIWKTFDEVEELPNHLKHIHLTKDQYEKMDNSENRKQYVLESLPDLRFLKCTGGEPFVSNHFLEVLKVAVESGHSKHITLSITTNGTKFNRKITELFEHFEAIDINVSVDGTDSVYEYIRFPFKYKQWHDRVIDFLTDMEDIDHPKFKIRFSTIVTAYNYLNLFEIQKEIDKIQIMFPFCSTKWHNNFDFDLKPDESELHAKFLPEHLLLEGYERAKKIHPELRFKHHPLQPIYHFANWHRETETKREELRKSTLILDKQRNQTYKVLDPKLVEWLDE